MNQTLLYIRQRALNAARMVRHGEFRKIGYVILVEIRRRFRTIPPCPYEDPTRLIPPSPRPTKTQLVPPPAMKANRQRVAEEIQRILAEIDIDEASGS